ncbi:MAG: hypothetical protein KGL46_10115 [Hyphomicrobiales bacterium]|nr:hypothetical protein [Hyphomicrobiales bacterium]
MSIAPLSDLVFDVARAADPARAAAAAKILGASSIAPASVAATPDNSFRKTLASAAPPPLVRPPKPQLRASASQSAYSQLGALLVQKMIEGAMPDHGGSMFGKGFAGSTWKSMLAEHVAQAVAPRIFPATPALRRGEKA